MNAESSLTPEWIHLTGKGGARPAHTGDTARDGALHQLLEATDSWTYLEASTKG